MQLLKSIETIRNFNRYYANKFNTFDRELYVGEYSLNEARVIAEIQAQGETTASKIQRVLGFDKGQLSKIITKLEGQKLLTRGPDSTDRRHYQIKLTQKGIAAFTELTKLSRDYLTSQLSSYSASQLQLISTDMHEIQNILEKKQQVKIRKGTLADIGYIADLHSRIYQQEIPYNAIFHQYVFKALTEYVQNLTQGITWIAEVNGRQVGTISLIKAEKMQYQVRWFAVDSRYQGLGIGKKLVQSLMNYAQTKKIKEMYLWTVDELVAARHLYGQQGFELVESVKNNQWCDRDINEEKWTWQAKERG